MTHLDRLLAKKNRVACRCVQTKDVLDTTECPLHPVTCEAIHPTTGQGCQHPPGHRSDNHSYLESWPNGGTAY